MALIQIDDLLSARIIEGEDSGDGISCGSRFLIFFDQMKLYLVSPFFLRGIQRFIDAIKQLIDLFTLLMFRDADTDRHRPGVLGDMITADRVANRFRHRQCRRDCRTGEK